MSNHDQPPMLMPPYSPPLPSPSSHPAIDYDSDSHEDLSLREYFHILLKRKWWVIGTFLFVFVGATLFTFLRTPIYQSTALLQITEDNPASKLSMEDAMSKLTGNDSLEKFQQTQYKILQSESLALRVIQTLNLKETPDFKEIREDNPDKSENDLENLMIKKFLKQSEVTPTRNSFLVEVSFQSPDKVMAQKIVNAMADEYMYLSIDRRNDSFALVRKWLDKQLQEMESKVEAAQRKLYKFGQKTDIYALDDQAKDNVVVQKFVDLSSLLTRAQAERTAKEAQYRQIKDNGPNAPLIVNNPLVASLRQQLVTQQAKVSAMKKVYREGHPDLMGEQANLTELRGRLQSEVNRLQESVKADFEAANRTEKLLNDSFKDQKGEMAKLQDNLIDFQILRRDAQTNEQLYLALLSRVKEANIAGTMVPTNLAVIDPPRLSEKPIKPKPLRDLALAAVLGLTLGVGMAILMEHLDDSIQSIEDLERFCSLPSLGAVPLLSSNGKKALYRGKKFRGLPILRYLTSRQRRGQDHAKAPEMDLIVSKQPQSMVSEAIGHIYSSIMLSASGRPPGAIMVTSPSPSEGKTTLVANLAQSYALNGRQVVLIDCDLRKPRLHQVFELDSQPGLSNFLTGHATLEEILRPTGIPNLTIITGGTRPPNPANLLNSDTFKELITQLRERFQHIIIDTPPVLGFADARFISTLVDGVLLVAHHGKTHKSAGRLARQLLSQAPVLGAVLNSVSHHGHGYGGYYYQYNYKYYSKYYGDKADS